MKDLATLSDDELQAELERRKKAEKTEKQKQRKNFILAKDNFLNNTIHQMKQMHDHLKSLKENTIQQGTDLYYQMFDIYGREPKQVNQFSIINENNDKKIVIEAQERVSFTEEASVPIQEIKDFFRDKFKSRSKLVYNLLDTLLIKNNQGDYDPKLLTKLRKQVNEIDDAKLTKAFEHLENCQTVVGSSTYVRGYEKDKNGKWKDIVLQFSSL